MAGSNPEGCAFGFNLETAVEPENGGWMRSPAP
jgi:hypothetical protein